MLALYSKNGFPNIAEEFWVIVQAASCFCHYSQFLEVACLHFLITQLILFPSWVSEEVEDEIAVVNSLPDTHRKQGRIKSKLGIRLWIHQGRIDMKYFL